MPDREDWEDFFDPEIILDQLQLSADCGDLVEFGCGYGTFTIAAAQRLSGTVRALDIDPDMLGATREKMRSGSIENVELILRDFVAKGSGLADQSVDFAMLFNILHVENPLALLREAHRNLSVGGRLGVIHWNHDEQTPRGPPLDIRPRPEQCLEWALTAGFKKVGEILEMPPYHYGILLRR